MFELRDPRRSSAATHSASIGKTSAAPRAFSSSLACERVNSSGARSISSSAAISAPDNLRAFDQRPAFDGHAPDAAVRMVAALVAEVDFAVLNDRVVPVGNVQRAVGSHLGVDRPKRRMRRLDDLGLFLRGVARADFGQREAADAMGAKVVGDQAPLPIVRESGGR